MIVDGRYRVLQTIRDSDDHAEYLTEHELIGRRMVVKVLHPGAAGRAEAVSRFIAEAEAAGKLRHPNIVESIDMGFVDGRPFVVFEHLHGAKVSEEIARLGRMPVRRAVHIARQVAAALGAAHLEDIVHGGLDSDHVYLIDRETDPDFAKVLGLGQADDSRGIEIEALSPEQVVGGEVDHRCDVWSLGVMLYEMITGKRPFSADVGAATARRRIVSADAPMIDRSDVPPALVEAIMTCLAKHPDERFQDMAEVDAALTPFDVRFARGSSTTIPPLPMVGRVRRPSSSQAAISIPARTSAVLATRTPSRSMSVQLPGPTTTLLPMPGPSPTQPPVQRSRKVLIASLAGAALVCAAGVMFAVTRGSDPAPEPSRSVAAAGAVADQALGEAGARVEAPTDVEVAVAADAPNARVTFRRRVHNAPVAVQVTPGDMVELIEVSAPGHKTERYWLTIDRATNLHAHLLAGEGLVEATELETLVALGETDAEPAPVAEPAPAAKSDRTHTTSKQSARRSIGRHDGDAAAPVDPPVAEVAAEPAAAGGFSAEPGSAPAANVAVAAAPEPVFASRLPAGGTAAAAGAEPAVEATKPAAPRQVAAGFLESNRIAGNARILPDNATRQAMTHQGSARIVGKFKMCVSAAGAVSKVSMISSSGYDDYDKHIMTELRAWSFKPIAINGEVGPVCATVAIAYSQQ